MRSLKWKLFSWSELLQLRHCLRSQDTDHMSWAAIGQLQQYFPRILDSDWWVGGQWSVVTPLPTVHKCPPLSYWMRQEYCKLSPTSISKYKCNLQFATFSTVSTLKWTVFLTYNFAFWQWYCLILKTLEGTHDKKDSMHLPVKLT